MPLLALGINHKTAPVTIRERVAFSAECLVPALQELIACGGAREAAILSTCNRTELYCGLDQPDAHPIVRWLGDYHALQSAELKPYIYQHPDGGAVRHMLRVASGLDSMILGEPQILGQIKAAYRTANSAGTLGTLLNRLFQHTFAVAKQVRTDTCIGASPVSVAFAAVSLTKQIYAELSRQTALLIGAGDTIELVARHLREHNIGRLIVANRTLERAHELAALFGGYAISLEEIPAHLAEADIVISSTASPTLILSQAEVKSSLKTRKRRPVLMIDLAVPRDIDPLLSRLDDVYLYTVDDLQDIIAENLQSRRAAAQQAEEIVDVQVNHFMAWMRAQDGAANIRALRQRAEELRDEVHSRALRQLQQGKAPEEVLRFLANTLTNKLIHDPSVGLREATAQGRSDLIAVIKSLYQLKDN
ncbi:MAG: glutamyl-tRNA reductase [Candidatus Competibacteraceae bacterium]|nr:glutamyl-tRNA reductase [Candidatus Competibacteraceae bacterium]